MSAFETSIGLARAKRRPAKISLTPLIDVVFILLVFFMLASSFLDWRSIALSAASGKASGGGVEGSLLVDVGRDAVRLSGKTLTLEALQSAVAERVAADPAQKVLLRPARGVAMQRLVNVLDRLEAAGARDVSLLPGARL